VPPPARTRLDENRTDSLRGIKALTFDTGGTVLNWHDGFVTALQAAGEKHGVKGQDWDALANKLRIASMAKVVSQGKDADTFKELQSLKTFDDGHREALEELLPEMGLTGLSDAEKRAIWFDAPHSFRAWSDFPAVLPKLRENFLVCSFTLLSYRLIIDTAKANGLSWDAVFSCEGIGKYKIQPESYLSVAKYLQLHPSEICMVATHNFDLNAARACGYKSAFVKRIGEWGPTGHPETDIMSKSGDKHVATPDEHHDIVCDTFPELAERLGVDLA